MKKYLGLALLCMWNTMYPFIAQTIVLKHPKTNQKIVLYGDLHLPQLAENDQCIVSQCKAIQEHLNAKDDCTSVIIEHTEVFGDQLTDAESRKHTLYKLREYCTNKINITETDVRNDYWDLLNYYVLLAGDINNRIAANMSDDKILESLKIMGIELSEDAGKKAIEEFRNSLAQSNDLIEKAKASWAAEYAQFDVSELSVKLKEKMLCSLNRLKEKIVDSSCEIDHKEKLKELFSPLEEHIETIFSGLSPLIPGNLMGIPYRVKDLFDIATVREIHANPNTDVVFFGGALHVKNILDVLISQGYVKTYEQQMKWCSGEDTFLEEIESAIITANKKIKNVPIEDFKYISEK